MIRFFIISILSILLINHTRLLAQEVYLNIEGIRSSEGTIAIGIFKDDKSFRRDQAFKEIILKKNKMKNGSLYHSFSLTPGTYGLALLDDENNDGKMNYTALGIPKEGYGFSNYLHSGLKRPRFTVFSFDLNHDQEKSITCIIKYVKKDKRNASVL